jgi:DNA-binding NarL/FixJ family response regulator
MKLILLIEGDAAARIAMRLVLARAGFTIVETDAPEAASALIEEHAPDLVIAAAKLASGVPAGGPPLLIMREPLTASALLAKVRRCQAKPSSQTSRR